MRILGWILQVIMAAAVSATVAFILFMSGAWYFFIEGIEYNLMPWIYLFCDIMLSTLFYKFFKFKAYAITFLIVNGVIAFLFYFMSEAAMGV